MADLFYDGVPIPTEPPLEVVSLTEEGVWDCSTDAENCVYEVEAPEPEVGFRGLRMCQVHPDAPVLEYGQRPEWGGGRADW